MNKKIPEKKILVNGTGTVLEYRTVVSYRYIHTYIHIYVRTCIHCQCYQNRLYFTRQSECQLGPEYVEKYHKAGSSNQYRDNTEHQRGSISCQPICFIQLLNCKYRKHHHLSST